MSNLIQDKIKIEGIQSMGYGIMPKSVAKDTRLTIESKAIYAYLVSFAGAGSSAFPKLKTILEDLAISEKRFYKHRKILIEHGYISVEAFRNEKSVIYKNVYTLHTNPTSLLKSPTDKIVERGVSVKTTDRVSVKTTDRGIRQNDCDKLQVTTKIINNRQLTTDDDENNINKKPSSFLEFKELIQTNDSLKFLAQELIQQQIPNKDIILILDYFANNLDSLNPAIIYQQLLWCKEKSNSDKGISSYATYFINGYKRRLDQQNIEIQDDFVDSLSHKLGLASEEEELPIVPMYNWLKA